MVIYYVVIYNTDINIAGNICAAGVIKQPLQSSCYRRTKSNIWRTIPPALKMPAQWGLV